MGHLCTWMTIRTPRFVLCCVVLCEIAIAASVRVVQAWFAQCHLQQLAKAEEHLKRRCGMVTPRVKGEMERLI